MGHAYPELRDGADGISGVLAAEEGQFRRTFANGMRRLEEGMRIHTTGVVKPGPDGGLEGARDIDDADQLDFSEPSDALITGSIELSGDIVFQLHDTYGFQIGRASCRE